MENEEDVAIRRNRRLKRRNNGKKTQKIDLMETLTNDQLKTHTRFGKTAIKQMANTFREELTLQSRGCPISVENTVCIALIKLASGSLNRINGLVANRIHRDTARKATERFVNALFQNRKRYMRPPTEAQMGQVAYRMFTKYGLEGFVAGVDGVQFRFEGAPRSTQAVLDTQQFWCRKQFYSVNCLVLGDDEYVYYVDPSFPGSVHDARVWNISEAKGFVDDLKKEYVCAGDSGYTQSNRLVIPFRKEESIQDERKALFNGKLSQIRTEFTEVKFGRVKNQWRCLKALKSNLELSQRTIVACFVLRNIAFQMKEEIAEGSSDEDDSDLDSDSDDDWMENEEKIEPRTEFLNEDPTLERHLTRLSNTGLVIPRVLDRGPLTAREVTARRLREGKARRSHLMENMKVRRKTDANIRPVT